MFERFTERARKVVTNAQEEARTLKHGWVGTEHLLLGLIVSDGLASIVLGELELEIEDVRERVKKLQPPGEEVVVGQIPYTPRAKKVLELGMREALALGQNYIGTEHILLGLVREGEGVAARILQDKEISAEAVRQQVLSHLVGPNRYREPVMPPVKLPIARHVRNISTKITALKDEALDAGLVDIAYRLREIERDLL